MTRDGILRIYLAGKMSGLSFEEMNNWRIDATGLLNDVYTYYNGKIKLQVVNPVDYYNFEEEDYQSDKEVMDFDLAMVRDSDVVLVNLAGLSTSTGTAIELYECMNRKIPVIAFGSDNDYWNLHPWVSTCITRKEDSMEAAVNYIENFYMK